MQYSSDKAYEKPQVTCFHDGNCPLCRVEIKAMQHLDKAKQIRWVDISQDKAALAAVGITYEAAMQRIHVLDTSQQMQTGVKGFMLVWQRLPYYRRLARLFERFPFLLMVMEKIYCWFARYRLRMTGRAASSSHRRES